MPDSDAIRGPVGFNDCPSGLWSCFDLIPLCYFSVSPFGMLIVLPFHVINVSLLFVLALVFGDRVLLL